MDLDMKICLALVVHSLYAETISSSGNVSYIFPG